MFEVAHHSQQEDISTLFMQYGQFIDYDITASPNGDVEQEPECCLPDPNNENRKWIFPGDGYNKKPDDCFPIEIPEDDKYWAAREGGVCSLREQNQVQRLVASPECGNNGMT